MTQAMLNKEDMVKLEASILDLLIAKQEAIGTTDKALGEQAFPWVKSPIMKIQRFKGKGGQIPQQIRFADLLNLCEALGLSWMEVCRESIKKLKHD